MTIKDLNYFLTIVQEKSITQAAAKLFIAQPALSQCIQKLEKETGVRFFVRSNAGVQLTSEGECFLEFAKGVLRDHDVMQQKLKDIGQNLDTGEIRLGFTGTQASYVLPYILPTFEERFPKIHVTLVEATSDQVEERVLQHEVDLGILHNPVLRKGLDCFELSRDDMAVVPRSDSNYRDFVYTKPDSSEQYISMEFFREEPLIMTQQWQRSRMVTDGIFASAGIVPRILQITRNISTMDALAQVDYVSAIIPRKQISEPLKQRGVYTLEPSLDTSFSFIVATKSDAYLSIPVRHFIDVLREKQFTF